MSDLPLVSIVTPSYNQAAFLEETILSILNQDYPNIEYIIIDGDSSDGSVDIIRKYEQKLAYWTSEADQGQAHALQKGFARATGDIVAYLNSDDVYLPSALSMAVSAFQADSQVALTHGDSRVIDSTGKVVAYRQGLEGDFLRFFLRQVNPILQPSTFLKRSVLCAVGGIDPTLHMVMDYDLWCRIALRGMQIKHISTDMSLFRIHGASKTKRHLIAFAQERWRLIDKYLDDPVLSPILAPYRNRLYAMAHLRLANAHWISGEARTAHDHYRQMLRLTPSCAFSRAGLNLLVRFATGRRSLRGRVIDWVE